MHVTTAEQSAQRDAAAIASGVEGFTLMLHAGTQAAAAILRIAGGRVAHGVDVVVGSGNNGGDGYIVAAQLARLGIDVRVFMTLPPTTPDAKRAKALAQTHGTSITPIAELSLNGAASTLGAQNRIGRGVVVDALLGTGARGELREPVRNACEHIRAAQQRGSLVVALDVPSGLNATTGEIAAGSVSADVTIMFGTVRLGALSARHVCGALHVVDIGLGVHATQPDDAANLATPDALRSVLPAVPWDAHKGVRGRVLIVGGNGGMAGAVHLASCGALASGAGLVRASVAPESVAAVQAQSAAVVCGAWPRLAPTQDIAGELAFDPLLDEALVDVARHPGLEHIGAPNSLQHDIRNWAHVVAIGPGLGRDAKSAKLLHYVLECAEQSDVRLVLDADALTVVAQYDMLSALRRCADTRDVVITPHAGEFRALAKALDLAPHESTALQRLTATRAMAVALHCTVLSKGTPTVCASANGDAWFVPRGSNALATGGTGDVLTGVIAAMLASSGTQNNALHASGSAALSAIAAWVHGVAGEKLPARGSTVSDVVAALPLAWLAFSAPTPLPWGVLASVPDVHQNVVR